MTENRLPNRADDLALLEWYRAAGVDLAVGETPVDRFVAPVRAEAPAIAATMPQRGAPPEAPPPPPVALLRDDGTEARALAEAAGTLDALRAAMEAYEGCGLKKRATQLVFADGNPEAQIMIVGEGPGAEEDREGRPFVGAAGQLLDRMLSAIGLDRTNVYIANMVPWRPPGNRDPSPEELAQCAPFLIRQVELVAPKFLLTLGNTPTRALFSTTLGITRLHGQWRDLEVGRHRCRALATFHPAYLLRTPSAKGLAWADLLDFEAAIHLTETGER